ncbi:MAG: alpha/beta fold hydrolase [Rhodospirillaceae bacterium]|nr:alpha/beta fold hydrolase [Rhodospirillaceae bacterium]
MPTISIGDADIYYERHGQGPTLMLVPGLGGTAAAYRNQIPAFAKHFEVIVHDHRGAGQSSLSRIRYSVDQMANDALKLMDALGIAKAHYLGHSTGGAMGQVLAVEHPDRIDGLVLSATWAKSDTYFKRCFAARKQALATGGAEAYLKASNLALFPPWFINERIADIEAMEALGARNFGLPEIWESRIDAISAHDRLADIPKIRHRTLVIVAEDDMVTPLYFSQQLAAAVPNATLKTLKTGGHMCMITVPDDYNRAVLDWLTAIEHV